MIAHSPLRLDQPEQVNRAIRDFPLEVCTR